MRVDFVLRVEALRPGGTQSSCDQLRCSPAPFWFNRCKILPGPADLCWKSSKTLGWRRMDQPRRVTMRGTAR